MLCLQRAMLASGIWSDRCHHREHHLLSSVKTLHSSEEFLNALGEVVQCVAQRFAAEFNMSAQEVLKPSITGEVESGAEVLTNFLADVFSATEHRFHLVSAPPTNPSGSSAGCFF